jgi:PAS domain-containing protein
MSSVPDRERSGQWDASTTESHDTAPVAPQAFGDRRFRTLVEQVRDFAIFMTDADGRHVTWNEGVLLLTGYEEPSSWGCMARSCSHPRIGPEVRSSASCAPPPS